MTQVTIDQLATTRAIERSGGHQYTLIEGETRLGPFPGCTAITALQDSLGGSGGLMNWAVAQAMDAVALHTGSTDHITDWEQVRSMAFQAMNVPANVGNAVHIAVDEFNRSLPLEVNELTAPFVAHYASALRREGIDVLSSERYVVNAELKFGGTYDSLVTIGGETGPLDVKTGRSKPSQRLQLTGLSMGEWHGEAGLEPERMPPLDDVGWILLLRPDGYELIRHDITPQDKEHFIRLVGVWHAIREWNGEER